MKLLVLSSGYSGITFPCLPKDALSSPLPTAAEKAPTSTRDQQVATVSEAQQWTVTQPAELSTTGKKQNKKIDNHWSVDSERMNKTSHWPREPSSWWTSNTSLQPQKKGRIFIFQTFHCFYQFKFHHNSKHNSNFHFCFNSTTECFTIVLKCLEMREVFESKIVERTEDYHFTWTEGNAYPLDVVFISQFSQPHLRPLAFHNPDYTFL